MVLRRTLICQYWFANYLEAHLGFDPISISPIKIVAMGTVSLRKSQKLSLSLSFGFSYLWGTSRVTLRVDQLRGVVLEVGSETPGANNVLQQLTWIGNLR